MRRGRGRAFSLIELLVVVAVIALLASLLAPALRSGREQARAVRCGAQLQQLGVAIHLYAAENGSAAPPLAYADAETVTRHGGPVYWFGVSRADGVDPSPGPLWSYARTALGEGGLLECPSARWGDYQAQGASHAATSTYGYNGYYLSPATTPGWSGDIGRRPWQRVDMVRDAARVLAFGDTLIEVSGRPKNSALLDPPLLYSSSTRSWRRNRTPTNAFRHTGRTAAVLVDGHVERFGAEHGTMTQPRWGIGVILTDNDPWYVPDWRSW
jgi:prepilin-type N-terminal cleavage/methylation domain-containing protein/prepilin-type processing-associated H-X9-DG protein